MVNEEYPQEEGQVQYQSVPVSPNELYANAIQEEKVRNIISQLDPDNQLQEIEMRIRGYKKNVFSQDWEKIDESIPEPPKLLISRFISYLGGIMNQNTIHGNLNENQVNKIMKQVIEYVTDELDTHVEEYGFDRKLIVEVEKRIPVKKIKVYPDGTKDITYFDELRKFKVMKSVGTDYTEMTRIGDIIINSCFFVLTRALEGQEAKRMWKALSLTESYNTSSQKSKFGEALKFWK